MHKLLRFHKCTLKGDLDDVNGSLDEVIGRYESVALEFTTGKYINTGGSGVDIGDAIDVSNPGTYATLKYAIASCEEGDRFLLNVTGAASGRAWAFLTNSNVLISRADASVTLSDYAITAPQNAKKVVINDNFQTGTSGGTAYKLTGGTGKVVRFDIEQDKTEEQKARARANIGAADSASVSSSINYLESEIAQLGTGLSDEAKEALLNCFQNVAWTTQDGQTYYDALEAALDSRTYPCIVAIYTKGYHIIRAGDDINTLKDGLVVTYYTDRSDGTVVSASDYTLNGSLSEGRNAITVSYNEMQDVFRVTAQADNVPSGYTSYDYIEILKRSDWSTLPIYKTIDNDDRLRINDTQTKASIYFGTSRNLWNINYDFYIAQKTIIANNSTSAVAFGGRADSNKNFGIYQRLDGAQVGVHINGVAGTRAIEPSYKVAHHKITYNQSTPVWKIGESDSGASLTAYDGTSNSAPLMLFLSAVTTGGDTTANAALWMSSKVGMITLSDASSGTKVAEYVPVIRNSDNRIGMYDTVNDAFYSTTVANYATRGNSNCLYNLGNWTV